MPEQRYVMEWERGLDYAQHIDGVVWHQADPPPRRHTCWPQTRAIVNGHYVERCACGAFGPAPFFMLGRDEPRVAGDTEPRHLFMRGLEILRGR